MSIILPLVSLGELLRREIYADTCVPSFLFFSPDKRNMNLTLKDNHTIRYGGTLFPRHCSLRDHIAVPERIAPTVISIHGRRELYSALIQRRWCASFLYASNICLAALSFAQ